MEVLGPESPSPLPTAIRSRSWRDLVGLDRHPAVGMLARARLAAAQAGSVKVRAATVPHFLLRATGSLTTPAVRIATTALEREGIYRQRFKVNVEEMALAEYPSADHAKRHVEAPADSEAGTTLLYIGEPGAPLASSRVQVWPRGEIPAAFAEKHSLHRLPDVGSLVVGESSGTVISPSARGTDLLTPLLTSAVECLARQRADVVVGACRPGLLRHYAPHGYRAFGGQPLELFHAGLLVPVLLLVRDFEHLARVGAPSLATLQRLEREGLLSPRDPAPLIAACAHAGVETDPARVAAAVATTVAACSGDRRQHLLSMLSVGARARLVQPAYTVDVGAGLEVLSAGIPNREAFVVLRGVFEQRSTDASVAQGVVDFFGANALLGGGLPERRTQSVHAVTDGQLLVLQHRDIVKLEAEYPHDALEIYKAAALRQAVLAGVLAPPDSAHSGGGGDR